MRATDAPRAQALLIRGIQCRRLHRNEGQRLAKLAAAKFEEALRYDLADCTADARPLAPAPHHLSLHCGDACSIADLTLCNFSFLKSALLANFDDSVDLLQRAIAANPRHVRSYYYLSLAYSGQQVVSLLAVALSG